MKFSLHAMSVSMLARARSAKASYGEQCLGLVMPATLRQQKKKKKKKNNNNNNNKTLCDSLHKGTESCLRQARECIS